MTHFNSLLSLGWLALGPGLLASLTAAEPATAYRVYVGTYTGGAAGSKGIYQFDYPATGEPGPVTLAAEAPNPTFLALHPQHRVLYAASEIANFAGGKSGAVSAFAIPPDSAPLTLLNQQPSGGAGPCHLTVDASGRCLLVANYSGGNVAAFPLAPDGRLEAAATLRAHTGSSIHPQRQKQPYAHFIAPSPDNRFALACDLGADRVFVYALAPATGGLVPHDPPAVALEPGAGPRHLAFHPQGRFTFVVNELNSTVTSFAWDAVRGTLQPLASVSTLPAGYTNASTTAEIAVHPNGRFLYASNRGHDSLAVFAIATDTGRLSLVEIIPSGGKTPRCFALAPDGRSLLAANQGANNVVPFALDPATGRLRATGKSLAVPNPVCVVFLPR